MRKRLTEEIRRLETQLKQANDEILELYRILGRAGYDKTAQGWQHKDRNDGGMSEEHDDTPKEREAIDAGLTLIRDYEPKQDKGASDFDKGMAILQEMFRRRVGK